MTAKILDLLADACLVIAMLTTLAILVAPGLIGVGLVFFAVSLGFLGLADVYR